MTLFHPNVIRFSNRMNVVLCLHFQLMLPCKNGFMGFVVKAVDALRQ